MEKTQRKANVKNRITIITPPDDIAQDGVRILVYGCTKEQTLLISSVIYQLEECKPTIIYVSNGQNDSEWALDKKLKCSIIVFNAEAELTKLGKAGRSRWKGVRPQTRGVAMNPVDHPLGGGEGKSSGGRVPVSPWGKPEKKTRKKKKYSNKSIVRRRSQKGRN